MKRLIIVVCLFSFTGCATMAKIERGNHAIGDRLAIQLEGAWNHLDAPGLGPAQTWTMEGLPIDYLLLYSGIKDGVRVHEGGGYTQKDFVFRATMQPEEIVAMFEGMLIRDGSSFELKKLEPSPFGGLAGFRFDYTIIRKVDNVVLSGVGWGAVSKGELFAILYMAPRLVFFARHEPQVERIAMSAKVRE